MLKITTIPTGLKVATYKTDRPGAAISLTFPVGFRSEGEGEGGISHFLEHMLFDGTKKYPNPKIFREAYGNKGGFLNARTSKEFTEYHGTILVEQLDTLFDVISEMTQRPLLTDEFVLKQQQVIKEETIRTKNNPPSYVQQISHLLAWPNQPLGNTLIKDEVESNLTSITKEKLQDFMNKNYGQDGAVLTIVGNVEHDVWVDKANLGLANLSLDKKPDDQGVTKAKGIQLQTSLAKENQTNLVITFYSDPINSEHKYAISVLSRVLRERLYEILREEKALCYSITSSVGTLTDTGLFTIQGGFKSGSINEVIETINSQIEDLKSSGLSESELNRVVEKIRAGIAFSTEDSVSIRAHYSSRILKGIKPLTLEEDLVNYQKVNHGDVMTAANRIFDNNFKVSAVATQEDISSLEKIYS